MSLSKTRLAFYGLLLAAALTGLLIPHTQSSEAAPPQPSDPVAPVSPAQEPTAEESVVDTPPLASLFRSHHASDQRTASQLVSSLLGPVRDVFVLSPTMDRHYRVRSASSQNEKARQAQQSIDQFRGAHRLQGTFLQAHDKWAVVDGAIVRVGQKLDAFQLQKIEHYRVVFKRGADTVVLELPDGLNAQVHPAAAR
ncbi:MAG TPA: hypothetical protein VMZ31_02075 [Phycisphaerae bacterium]|nr:hypothetical protein [Phycisphaerae bacterium]